MIRRTILFVALALLLACSAQEAPTAETAPIEGREETRALRNTEAVGYSGDAIADKVDGALDASEKRKADMDRAADEQPQ